MILKPLRATRIDRNDFRDTNKTCTNCDPIKANTTMSEQISSNTATETSTLLSPVAEGASKDAQPNAASEPVAQTEEQKAAAAEAEKNKTPEQKEADKVALEKAAIEKSNLVPEKYELKSPEGVTLDAEAVEKFTAIAKEAKLTSANAQKIADLAVAHTAKLVEQNRKAQVDGWMKTRESWVTELKADKEVGGANFDTSRDHALRAIARFGDANLKAVIDTGWGDNPALFKTFVKIGKALNEDKFVDGDVSKGDLSQAERLYPSHR